MTVITPRILGICMQAYDGGRAEIHIRHTPVPVVYTDFLSQYPTVNTNLGLWRFLIAKKLTVENATKGVRTFLQGMTVDKLLDRRTWPKLNFFAMVRPDGDILPVRTNYGDVRASDQTNIGLNPLKSERGIWYAGSDIVGSYLLTGKVPEIIKAIRLRPVGVQKGLRVVSLGESTIDPRKDDFFKKVIEERKGRNKTDPLYYFLKILANAGCYGIYAEVNRQQTGKNNPKKIEIFSGDESRIEQTCIFEEPGPWYFPPISALITAGGRLLLAMLERMVTDAGGTYLMCDTDSMAIVASEHCELVPCEGGNTRMADGKDAIRALSWAQVRQISDRFASLNPYDRTKAPGSVLNIVEEINFDRNGKQRQIYGYGISAKRYSLYTMEDLGLKVIKVSEHGLGLYYRPKEGRDPECDVALWIKEGWEWMLNRALGLPSDPPEWFKIPVMRRIAISTPNVMAALRNLDRNRARPYNFAISPVLVNLSNEPITLLGHFEKDSSKWKTMRYINIHDGTVYTLDPPTLLALPQTFEMIFSQYHRHLEYKSFAPDGTPCKTDTRGLLKRCPVTATGFRLIGKETERGWEQAEDICTLLPSLKRYERNTNTADQLLRDHLQKMSLNALQKETGLSRNTILRARRGERVHPRSLRSLRIGTAAGSVSQ